MSRPRTAATPATAALAAAGVLHTVRAYDHAAAVSGDVSYGVEAAAALGIPPERVLKTLLRRWTASSSSLSSRSTAGWTSRRWPPRPAASGR